jgi:hypothetical protein
MINKNVNYIGKKFGKLTIVSLISNKYLYETKAICLCECGRTHVVRLNSLTSGATKSCGCINKKGTHWTHGKTHHRLYSIYNNIKTRCYNPKTWCYYRYGGRGIKMFEEWLKDFSKFYKWAVNNGYKENLTIDRINNDGDYCPENCRWVSRKQQANNTARNHLIEIDHIKYTIKEASEKFNIPYGLLQQRISHGWKPEDAICPKKKINQFC